MVEQVTHKMVNGVMVELTQQEIAEVQARFAQEEAEAPANYLKFIRTKRNELLSKCDWTVLSDSPVANQSDWLTYRQALRNVPQQPDLNNIQWPEKPTS